MPFRATNAANWSSIIRIGAKMAVIRRRIARRAVSSHTQRAGRFPYGESRLGSGPIKGIPIKSGDVILAADACYFRRSLETLHLPKSGHDRDAILEALTLLRSLAQRGARIFYGHDPEFWEALPQAPAAIT